MKNTDIKTDGTIVLVSDGEPVDQRFVDLLVTAGQSGEGDWPHAHPRIPRSVITRAQLWRAVAENFRFDGEPWSVPDHGYPSLVGPPATSVVDPPPEEPNRSSVSHNLLHSILGDFH
ncbi:hypothetical protein AB0G04_32995 [Actinoplanes sp. NPDC023801]|uniref:hypothetical protein n=1 Tax=Actinoplanes sp. NPDC023801 TaxID=3154595 RepID=UPI0033ECB4F4